MNEFSSRLRLADCLSSLWWVLLLRGITLIVLGGYALLSPGVTLETFVILLAIFAIVDGVLAVISGVMGWAESRGWTVVRGLVGIVLGAFVLAHPLLVGAITITIIVYLIAIQSIMSGILEIIVAIQHRREIEGEGWLIFSGVVSILFGLILCSTPMLSGIVLIQVAGGFAVVGGIAMIVFAFRTRRLRDRVAVRNPA